MSLEKVEIRPQVQTTTTALSGNGSETVMGLNEIYFQPNVGERKSIYSAGAGTTAITLSEDPQNWTYINLGGARWADWAIATQNINRMSNGYGAMIYTPSNNSIRITQYTYNSATRTFTMTNKMYGVIPTANNANITWSTGGTSFWQAFAVDRVE